MSITKFLPAALASVLADAGQTLPSGGPIGIGATGGLNNRFAKERNKRRVANKRARASRKINRGHR